MNHLFKKKPTNNFECPSVNSSAFDGRVKYFLLKKKCF